MEDINYSTYLDTSTEYDNEETVELENVFHSEFVNLDDNDDNGHHELTQLHADDSQQTDNNFKLQPEVFDGLPVPPNRLPNNFIFNHVVKNTKAFKRIEGALGDVRERQGHYKGSIRIQRDISYTSNDDDLDKHKLDIYMPDGAGSTIFNLPIAIHFHGGGWVRGDRKDEFRGSPAVCRQYSSNGIIAIAPSYRLHDCPGHMHDAVSAVLWVIKHAISLGGDPRVIFLSGHSAGANIAANLVCGVWLQSILEEYNVRILGTVCISGVYSLLKPLGGRAAAIKNKGFDKIYRIPVFGNNLEVLAKHSPVAQLRMMLQEDPYPLSDCLFYKFTNAGINWNSYKALTHRGTTESESNTSNTKLVKTKDQMTTSFLVLNAEEDVGLEHDGQRLVELLRQVQPEHVRKPIYHIFPGLTHATITLNDAPLSLAANFIVSTYEAFSRRSETIMNVRESMVVIDYSA
jgi:hypothetical protein